MVSLSSMITYIKHLQYSAKTKYFGPFYYIQIDPQDYDEWRTTPPEEEVHFQTPSKLGSPATPRSMATSSETRVTCLGTTDQLLPALPFPTPPSPKDIIWHPIIESGNQLQLNTSHSIGKMAKATLLTSSANIGSLQLCGPCSSLSCSGGARLPPS